VPYDEAYEAASRIWRGACPTSAGIRDRLGWAPTRRLDEILDDVVEYQRAGVLA
jgi:hypothetical protein